MSRWMNGRLQPLQQACHCRVTAAWAQVRTPQQTDRRSRDARLLYSLRACGTFGRSFAALTDD